MLVLRNPSIASSIADKNIRELVEQRFEDVCDGEEQEPDLHGFMICRLGLRDTMRKQLVQSGRRWLDCALASAIRAFFLGGAYV